MRRVAMPLAVMLVAAMPASAGAATQIGATFPPTSPCTAGTTYLQTAPIATYQVPFTGVITSWSFEASATPPAQLKFKVAQNTSTGQWTTRADSDVEQPSASTLNTFPTRITALAGDNIGLVSPTGGSCARGAGGFIQAVTASDPPPGTAASYSPAPNAQLDVSASLEPDADADGFGDETQDNCPGVSNPDQADGDGDGAGTACEDEAAPDTQITRGPKAKTKKRQATFEFSSNEAGSTFECSLDGGAFAPCSSPDTIKVKKGKHSFKVRAKDAAGNLDGSPATLDWKVKKKKKK